MNEPTREPLLVSHTLEDLIVVSLQLMDWSQRSERFQGAHATINVEPALCGNGSWNTVRI